MPSSRALEWLHRLIWALIYIGLLALVLGLATKRGDEALGWSLVVAGGLTAGVGFFLIWLRSRLHESKPARQQGHP